MKCVAIVRGQAHNDNGKIIWYNKGEVGDFKVCPPNFRPLEGEEAEKIDFATASEQELLASEWKFAEAKTAIKELYDKELKKGKKSDIVDQILDIRFRSVDNGPLKD